jgi:hypothetical protein
MNPEKKIKITRFEDLDVWKKSARLSADIFKQMMSLKDFGFRDQLTRSGLSVPAILPKDLKEILKRKR